LFAEICRDQFSQFSRPTHAVNLAGPAVGICLHQSQDRRLVPDHHYHALNYLLLAAKKIGVSEVSWGFQAPKVEMDFDPRTYDEDQPFF
jgi:hypothetical protein